MTFYEELKLHLRAGVPAIYVESSEWMRFHAEVGQCCRDLDKTLFFWNPMDGLTDSENNVVPKHDDKDFVAVLERIVNGDNNEVYVLELADLYLNDGEVVAKFAATIRKLRGRDIHVIIFSPTLNMPKILEKEFAVLDFPLPGRNEIQGLLEDAANKHHIHKKYDTADPILDAVRGLGATEIINAFGKIAVNHGKITAKEIPFLIAEKEQIIRKSGYLSFIRPDNNMESVGGLENLWEWLKQRKNAFGEKARKAKLNAPKGVLLLGVPGTGKSLCAKAVAQVWQMPLLRLDMGSIYSSGVGDSEANMRGAIKVAESMEPCILWIDEIEKGVSGGAGASGELDGGTSSRVFGSFLTWMQEKKKEVFIFATANDISRLPPEILRKGRFDEIFFVDLPGADARKDIFKIHLKSKGQSDKVADDGLISKTEGFSGAEIEAVVNEALFVSYTPGSNPVIKTADLHKVAGQIVPLCKTMGDTINDIREWAGSGRCRLANAEIPPEIKQSGGVVLRTEVYNPFIKKEKGKE